jgi:hypothetical protein
VTPIQISGLKDHAAVRDLTRIPLSISTWNGVLTLLNQDQVSQRLQQSAASPFRLTVASAFTLPGRGDGEANGTAPFC